MLDVPGIGRVLVAHGHAADPVNASPIGRLGDEISRRFGRLAPVRGAAWLAEAAARRARGRARWSPLFRAALPRARRARGVRARRLRARPRRPPRAGRPLRQRGRARATTALSTSSSGRPARGSRVLAGRRARRSAGDERARHRGRTAPSPAAGGVAEEKTVPDATSPTRWVRFADRHRRASSPPARSLALAGAVGTVAALLRPPARHGRAPARDEPERGRPRAR